MADIKYELLKATNYTLLASAVNDFIDSLQKKPNMKNLEVRQIQTIIQSSSEMYAGITYTYTISIGSSESM